MNKKDNSKQDVAVIEKLLKDNLKSSFNKLIKEYSDNRKSDEFLKYFIKSNILVDHFDKLFAAHKSYKNKKKDENSLFEDIVNDYFSQYKYVNPEFIQQLKINDLKMLQDIFYKKHAFKSIKHINSLKGTFSEYDSFLYLTTFLNKISTRISSDEKEIITFLKKTKFEDLFNLISYHLCVSSIEAMSSSKVISSKEPEVVDGILSSMVYPKVMDMVASLILNKKIELDNEMTIQKYEVASDSFLLKTLKFGLKPDKNKIIQIEKIFKHFKKIMSLHELINNLKYGEFTYSFSDNRTLLLSPKNKEDYLEFKKSGEKLMFHETLVFSTVDDYFSSFEGWGKVDYLNKATEKNMALSVELAVDLLGEDITINDQKIKFREMIWVISKLAERNKRMFGEKINGNDIENSIHQTCHENMIKGNTWSYINNRSKKDIVSASLGELKEQLKIESTPEEVISILNFFATDINNTKDREIDLVRKPFIKIGDEYLWSYSSLVYKDLYKIITMNIFPNPQQPKGYITDKATGYENKICQMFKSYAFKAISQVKPQKSNDKDIDVLAYKDGYLFIVETKVTYSRHDYQSIKWHTEGALKKAEEQLNKRKESYKDYLDADTLKKLGIKDVSEIKKEVPIIVTNSFEGKVNRGNGIFKVHERELEMYLSKGSSKALIKMVEGDYYWKLIKEKELSLFPEKISFNELEVISYV